MEQSSEKLIQDQLDRVQDELTTIAEPNKEIRCHFRVAPSWGTLEKDSIIMMDDHLKAWLYLTFKNIDKLIRDKGEANLSWDNFVGLMDQNMMIQRKDRIKDMNVQQSKSRSELNWFKFNGSADEIVRDGVVRWIRESIQDPELLKIIGEDAMLKIATIFSESGASVDSFFHFFANTDQEEYTLLDVGIIRIPDITKPSLQLFRIKIHVKRQDTRVFFGQSDTSELHLEANTRDYEPKEDVMKLITGRALKRAVDEMNGMFAEMFDL